MQSSFAGNSIRFNSQFKNAVRLTGEAILSWYIWANFANCCTSSAVVSKEHIQRTTDSSSFHTDECSLGCGGIFPRGQQAGARVRKRRREGNEWTARVERRYTIQRTIRWLKNRCQVGPTILFECPAQIPRSSLRSFSLWATPVPLSALAGLKMRIDRFYSMRGLQTCLYNTM